MKHILVAKKWGSADGTQKLGNTRAPPIGTLKPIDVRTKVALLQEV